MYADVPFPRYGIFLHFQPFSAILVSFQLKWLVLELISKLVVFNISNCNRNIPLSPKMRGQSTYSDVPFPRYGIFLHFQPCSVILASFQLKWLVLELKLKLVVFNISNCDRNIPLSPKMRGQSTYSDVPFPRYGIFLHFQPCSVILASFQLNYCFWCSY